jgi:hypothetical protein
VNVMGALLSCGPQVSSVCTRRPSERHLCRRLARKISHALRPSFCDIHEGYPAATTACLRPQGAANVIHTHTHTYTHQHTLDIHTSIHIYIYTQYKYTCIHPGHGCWERSRLWQHARKCLLDQREHAASRYHTHACMRVHWRPHMRAEMRICPKT